MSDAAVSILVVDDTPAKRLALLAALAPLGLDIVESDSGRSGLRALLEREFAVMLLDINLPDMEGYEVAELMRTRSKNAHTPILYVTAERETEFDLRRAYATGAVDFIVAPVVPEVLRAKVSVFVDLYRMRHEALVSMKRISGAAQTSVTEQAFGVLRLRESAPEFFDRLVQRFEQILDMALEQRVLRVGHPIGTELRDMAEKLGVVKAGPRDAIDICVHALNALSHDAPPAKSQAYAEESRLLVLELMGDLVVFYRKYFTGSVRRVTGDSESTK